MIIGLLNGLRREKGMSLIFISHDIKAMRALVDDILVMHDGEIVERGRVDAILQDPKHRATQELTKDLRK
jgi:ABC-type microcin C transport system duplicated ATPase subunit YejF